MSIEVLGSVYIISAILFVFGLKLMSSPATAVRGNLLSSVGMLMAVLITLTSKEILDYRYLAGAAILGAVVGVIAAQRVAMTGMPATSSNRVKNGSSSS